MSAAPWDRCRRHRRPAFRTPRGHRPRRRNGRGRTCRSRAPCVRKVLIVAYDFGLPGRITCVRSAVAFTKPHAALMEENPLSKIPTLVLDDGTVLYDSPVICEYLDCLHHGPKLFPVDPKQ